jgi:hypothetical protein
MGLFLVGILFGGLGGICTMALVIVGDERRSRGPALSLRDRTVNRAREQGPSWVIAMSSRAGMTSGDRLGTFSRIAR